MNFPPFSRSSGNGGIFADLIFCGFFNGRTNSMNFPPFSIDTVRSLVEFLKLIFKIIY